MTKKNNRDRAIKMQKLRHAVARLRNFRDTVPAASPKRSWLDRLKDRLGMGSST